MAGTAERKRAKEARDVAASNVRAFLAELDARYGAEAWDADSDRESGPYDGGDVTRAVDKQDVVAVSATEGLDRIERERQDEARKIASLGRRSPSAPRVPLGPKEWIVCRETGVAFPDSRSAAAWASSVLGRRVTIAALRAQVRRAGAVGTTPGARAATAFPHGLHFRREPNPSRVVEPPRFEPEAVRCRPACRPSRVVVDVTERRRYSSLREAAAAIGTTNKAVWTAIRRRGRTRGHRVAYAA